MFFDGTTLEPRSSDDQCRKYFENRSGLKKWVVFGVGFFYMGDMNGDVTEKVAFGVGFFYTGHMNGDVTKKVGALLHGGHE